MLAAVAAVAAAGCLDNPGVTPPPAEINFPVAMERADHHLFVANANFDLRYNSGSLQAYDLNAMETCLATCQVADRLSDSCVIVDPSLENDTSNTVLRSEPCPGLLASEVLVGSFASDLAVSPDRDRVYLSIRSESNLTFVRFDPATGQLDCGGDETPTPRCTEEFRRGNDALATERELELPLDPSGLHVGRWSDLTPAGEGDYALMAHRGGSVSLFVDVDDVPTLVDVLEGFPTNLQNIVWRESTQLGWLPSGSERRIGRVGVAADPDPAQAFLFDRGDLAISGIDSGDGATADTRDVAFDPDDDRAHVLSRRPEALFVVDTDSTGTNLEIDQQIEVCVGPSRVQTANLAGRTVAFVSCFDNDAIYSIDVGRGHLLGVTSGVSGPFVMSVDPARELLYVADFTSSVIRILSLAPLVRCLEGEPLTECAPRRLGTIGIPRAVEELR